MLEDYRHRGFGCKNSWSQLAQIVVEYSVAEGG